jgi:hypothetical protein
LVYGLLLKLPSLLPYLIEWAIETFIKRVNKIALHNNQFVLHMEVCRLGYSQTFVLAANDILIRFSDPGRWFSLVKDNKIPSYGPAAGFWGTHLEELEEVCTITLLLWDLNLYKR